MFTAKELYETLVRAWPIGAMPMFDNLPQNSRSAYESLAAHVNRPPSPVDIDAETERWAVVVRGASRTDVLAVNGSPIETVIADALRPLVTKNAQLAREAERLSGMVKRKTDTIDRMADTLRDAGAEIARLKAAPGAEVIAAAREALMVLSPLGAAGIRLRNALAAVESRQDCGKPDCGYCGHDEADARNGYIHPSTCPDLAVESRPAPAGEVTPRRIDDGSLGGYLETDDYEPSEQAPPLTPERARGARPVVLAFAEAMNDKLRANDHKGGWSKCSSAWLLSRLHDEVRELGIAVRGGDASEIRAEAADVGNFAMMIADVCGALGEVGDGAPQPLTEAEARAWETLYRVTACWVAKYPTNYSDDETAVRAALRDVNDARANRRDIPPEGAAVSDDDLASTLLDLTERKAAGEVQS